jgi:hypothetical protein
MEEVVFTGEERYISIDPGLSTGWATFRANGDLIRTGTLRNGAEQLYPFLRRLSVALMENDWKPLDVIVENYRLYPWKAMQQSWASLETVRFIGAVDFWAKLHEYNVHLQDPNIKGIGYKWAGITVPKNHDLSHETDAFVHGVYFLQRAGIRKPMQGRANGTPM